MVAMLHELMASDPWKDGYATRKTIRDISEVNSQVRDMKDYVKGVTNDVNYRLFEDELKNFEWNEKFVAEKHIERKLRPANVLGDLSALVNLTEYSIPDDIQLVMTWGPRFAFPSNVLDIPELVTELDSAIENKIPILLREQAKKLSAIQITKFHGKRYIGTVNAWLNFMGQRTTDFFTHNKQLVVLSSDKGKHTVVMNKETYRQKMNELLSEENTYRRTMNLCAENIVRNDQFVDRLIELKVLQKTERYRWSDKAAVTAKFYGLPKIHKTEAPLRPITSALNSPGRNLSTLLTNLLSPFFEDGELHVKNSISFKRFIDETIPLPGEVLVSFDVVSMFTNISVELAINIISKKRSHIERKTGIPFELLMEMLRFVLADCAQFNYDSETYSQTRGIAMGSPISPLIAKLVMSDLVHTQAPKLLIKPNFIKVYVDDTACCIDGIALQSTLDILNAYHRDIQFTMELENDGKINFLDVTLIRKSNCIITNWYKKPFASDRLLNYFSEHKRSTIMNVATAHIKTVLQLSDGEFFATNKQHIVERLRLNNFPEVDIMRMMNECYSLMKPPAVAIKKSVHYGAIPQINGLTNRINQSIQMIAPDLLITGRPVRRYGNFWSIVKDITDRTLKTNMILKVVCKCRKAIIVEHTRYKERCGEMTERVLETHTFTDSPCTSRHHFMVDDIEYSNGAMTAQKSRKKCEIMAALSNKIVVNRLERPSQKWMRVLKNKKK